MAFLTRPLRVGIGLATLGAVAAYRVYSRLAERGERVLHGRTVADVLDPYEAVEQLPVPGALLERDELPLADYDHLTLGNLRTRIRSLSAAELIQLRDYERTHADRLPVVTLFEKRLEALRS